MNDLKLKMMKKKNCKINEAAAKAHFPGQSPAPLDEFIAWKRRNDPSARSAVLEARALVMGHAVTGCGGRGLEHPIKHAVITATALLKEHPEGSPMWEFWNNVIAQIKTL